MIKAHILLLFMLASVGVAWCDEKPLMSVAQYVSYRHCEDQEFRSLYLKRYRLPTEHEKRMYVYANYAEIPDSPGTVVSKEPICYTFHLGFLCEWLIEDSPQTNTTFLVRFIQEKNKEASQLHEECSSEIRRMENLAWSAVSALSRRLGADAFPHLVELLETSSGSLQRSIISEMEMLFSANKDAEKREEWVRVLLDDVYPQISRYLGKGGNAW